MAKDFTKNMKLKSFNDIVGGSASKAEPGTNYVILPLSKLHDFKNHPYKVIEDEDMEELIESIKENGVIEPLEVREDKDGYEIISGHRRTFASRKAGLTEVPAFIKVLSDYEAVLHMTAANKYRSNILPSEKAFSYLMEMEALKAKRKADKNKNGQRTDAMLADTVGESRATIQRYIRLTNLIPEFLDLCDKGTLGVSAAQPLANFEKDIQKHIYTLWETTGNGSAKLPQTELENLYAIYLENGQISDNDILVALGIFKEIKEKPVKVTLNEKRLSQYFDKSYSQEDIEEVIDTLLAEWKEKQEHCKDSVLHKDEQLRGQYKIVDTDMTTDTE